MKKSAKRRDFFVTFEEGYKKRGQINREKGRVSSFKGDK